MINDAAAKDERPWLLAAPARQRGCRCFLTCDVSSFDRISCRVYVLNTVMVLRVEAMKSDEMDWYKVFCE